MRYFIAFIITFIIFILITLLYIKKLSHIIVDTPLQHNNHIIKIDIRNIPDSIVVPPTPKPTIKVARSKPIIPIIPKAIKKKVTVKKNSKPKKHPIKKHQPHKKKVVKKKIVKKHIKKKKLIKKHYMVKRHISKRKSRKKENIKPIENTQPPISLPIAKTTTFEEEMIYIPEPIKQPKVVQAEPQREQAKSDLGSFLGGPSTPILTRSRNSYPNQKIKKLYGSSFHTMTPTQKRFIKDNLDTIQQITQATLSRRGYPEGAGRTLQEGTNIVTFKLHPNGNISNLRLKTRIGYRALDENTLSLIRVAYKDYPYPSTTTQITFYVTYSIYGY